ncbi:MAG: T9SS type A sorting domain-containing protein, partial [Flavobacteriales bacterium]
NNWAMITANAAGMQYQWIDCANDSPIAGETGQSFVATQNGSYKVAISDGSCNDTSDCVVLTNVGIQEGNFNTTIGVYPNPTNGKVNVTLGANATEVEINVMDMAGKSYLKTRSTDKNIPIDLSEFESGVYFIRVTNNSGQKTIRLVKM